jgi:hypothetical protein
VSIRERVKSEIKDPRLRESSYLDTAILDVLESGTRTDNGEIPVASVVDKLDELHRENGTAENTTTERRPGREERRARATKGITNTEVVAAISLEVEKLREERFRNSEPPFSTVADAAAWVEAESAEDWERHKKTPSAKALEDIERLRQEYGPLEEVQIKTVMLPYQRPDSDHQKSVPTAPHTYLRLLANVTSRIASRTGLYQDALVMYLLTGFEPERRRASVKTTESTYAPYPSGPQLRTNHVEVSFYVRDLTEKQLRDIYNSVRGHITGLNRKAQIEERQARIYELVHEHGGPWRKDWKHGRKAKLLRAVLADAQREGLTYVRNGEEKVYDSEKGIEKAYLAARKRLEPPQSWH